MFARRIRVERVSAEGLREPCPLKWIDNFAMRNFTMDAAFDDTLPLADGLLEAGRRISLERLRAAMDDWLRRKSYLKPGDRLELTERARISEEPTPKAGIEPGSAVG
jgi:ADP-ribosylglycohydrolase